MRIGVPRETVRHERRVALVPDVVRRLVDRGHGVTVEHEAGATAGYVDDDYRAAGAQIVDRDGTWSADLVAVVQLPDEPPAALRSGTMVAGFLRPLDDPDRIARLAERGLTLLAFETLPRVTRAQPMDALSSQATAAGYQAVVVAADRLPRFFPMLTTAAGTIRPSKVLVLGAGVAGLQAIATARRLGAIVSAYDVRAAAREQVESLGASFIELDLAQQDERETGGYARELAEDEQARLLAALGERIGEAEVVITTAQIPGRPAPLLITRDAVERMTRGSVIVDAAAPTGGNCELTRPDEEVEHAGVLVLGPTNLPSGVARDASAMYARNVLSLIDWIAPEGELRLDATDEIMEGVLVAHEGSVVHPRVRSLIEEGTPS